MYLSKSHKYLFLAALAFSASLLCVQTQPASAVKATDFNAGNIIDDAVFYDKDAMTLGQIEAFIEAKTVTCDTWGTKPIGSGRTINGVAVNPSISRAQFAEMMRNAGNANYHAPPYICLTNYYENPDTKQTSFNTGATKAVDMLSAAEIIYKAAQTYNINPQVLLVTLKKEYGYAFTDDWPLKHQYNTMMGYACPDTGPGNTANCNSRYFGFYNQMFNAAWQLDYYKKNITRYNYQPGRWNLIQHSPNASCGTKYIYIENMATASLYIYTPYTPNDETLKAYPGTATCGAYGNRNFFMFFHEWFGTVRAVKFVPLDTPRKMRTKVETTKVVSYMPTNRDGFKLEKGREIQFETKTTLTDGRLCLRTVSDTAADSQLCVLYNELEEIPIEVPVEWVRLDSPRAMKLTKNTLKLVANFPGDVDNYPLEKGREIQFETKTTLTDGRLCLRTAADTIADRHLCILFSDIEEMPAVINWTPLDNPRKMKTALNTTKIYVTAPLVRDNYPLEKGREIQFETKTTLTDGRLCLRTAADTILGNQICIPYNELVEL